MRKEEDYNQWNFEKQKLNQHKKGQNVQVGEVRWYYCGVNVGNEIGKGRAGGFRRPCLILKNNLQNGLVLIAPLTTKNPNYQK